MKILHINLLPKKSHPSLRAFYIEHKWLIYINSLVLCFLVLWHILLQQKILHITQYIAFFNNTKNIETKHSTQISDTTIMQKIPDIAKHKQQRLALRSLFNALHNNIKNNLQLKRLDISPDQLQISGIANSLLAVTQLTTALTACKDLGALLTHKISRTNIIYDFSLTWSRREQDLV